MQCLHIFVAACCLTLLGRLSGCSGLSAPAGATTMVLYNYVDGEPHSAENLRFFLRNGVREDDTAAQFIIIHGSRARTAVKEMAPALDNVRLTQIDAPCHDFGVLGWLLEHDRLRIGYAFFVLLNSGVRGPFLPPYAQGKQPWHAFFTRRLQGSVRMVGPSISCRGVKHNGSEVSVPHVLPGAVAFDRVALDVLLDSGNILKCWRDKADVAYHSEMGASAALLDAGHNIDCFMERYQGVDWRHPAASTCNMQQDPVGNFALDGVTVLPYELMFSPFNPALLASGDTTSALVKEYSEWMSVD